MNRIGIFGGTFNPIHLGHAALAQSVYDSFRLNELIFMPSRLPPHKSKPAATPKERFTMVSLTAKALKGNFSVSDFELKSKGVSYTWLTLENWRNKHPEDVIYFLAGSDIFVSIGDWGRYEELFGLANFIVVNRIMPFEEMLKKIPDSILPRIAHFNTYKEELAGKVILYYMPPVSLSSTHIRGKVLDVACKEKLPLDVYDYIMNKKIYMRW